MKLYERELVPHRKTHHRRVGIVSFLPIYPEWPLFGQQTIYCGQMDRKGRVDTISRIGNRKD